MSGVTAITTTGKGIGISSGIDMGGAAIGRGIKAEDPTNPMIGAGVGFVLGSVGGTVIKGSASTVVKEGTAELTGALGGGLLGETVGSSVKDLLDNSGDKNERK